MLKKIAIYGDSILKGVMFDSITNKYHLVQTGIQNFLSDRPDYQLENKSMFGCTITKGMKILDRALEHGMDCDDVVLEFGGNDADFNWAEVSAQPEAEHLPHTELGIFRSTLTSMIDKLRYVNVKPVLMTLPPVDAVRYLDFISRNGLSKENILRWLGDVTMIYRYQEMYSDTIREISYEKGCKLADPRKYFLAANNFKQLYCEDGIHPNELGQDLIRRAFTAISGNALSAEA